VGQVEHRGQQVAAPDPREEQHCGKPDPPPGSVPSTAMMTTAAAARPTAGPAAIYGGPVRVTGASVALSAAAGGHHRLGHAREERLTLSGGAAGR